MSHPAVPARAALPDPSALGDLAQRLRSLWVIKMLGTPLGIGGFFVAYFWVMLHPQFTVRVMPLTAIDRMIGYTPGALPVYLSLWLYVSIAPALLKTGRDLFLYGLAALALSTTGLLIFILWPTTVPPMAVDWTPQSSIAFLKTVDVAANACPSLHVAFAVFTGLWLDRLLRELRGGLVLRAFNGLWCAAIAYSTLATRQHVFVDVLAGAPLGAVFALVHMHLAASEPGRN